MRIIPPGAQTQDLPLAGVEKIVDAHGRVIYWIYRVSSKEFSNNLTRPRDWQKMLEVGTTLDRRSAGGGNKDNDWTQLTPRIGWVFSPGLTIELSGGRRTFERSTQSHLTRKFLQVHFVGEFLAPSYLLPDYASIGVGRFWETQRTTFGETTYFYTDKGFTLDGGFGLLFPVAEHYRVRAEARIEGWFTEFAAWALAIGISRRIML